MSDHRHFQPNANDHLTCGYVRDDLQAWALGALEPAEHAMIKAHLDSCPDCRLEANQWLHVVSALPLALPPLDPPASLKQQLMDRVSGDQLAAVSPALPAAPTAPTAPADKSGGGGSTMAGRFSWSQVLVAPLIIALIVMTAWTIDLQDRLDRSAESNLIATVSDDAMIPAEVQTFGLKTKCQTCESSGRLLADPQTAYALFFAWDLDPDMAHQVWCVDDTGARKLVASLDVSSSGDVVQPLLFDQPIAGYSQIYVMSKNNDDEQMMMEMDETPMATPPPDLDDEQQQ